MDKEQILEKVTAIFKDVLDNDDIVLTEATVAADVQDWDSLNHIQLVYVIEKTFKIKFTTTEIYQFKNVGDMISTIQTKLSA